MGTKTVIYVAGIIIGAFFLFAQAEFFPERMYTARSKIKLNSGWKFAVDSLVSGDPSQTGFDDASWAMVNIPHSASYDAPTPEGEKAAFQGVCWYRKNFSVPERSRNKGKFFLEFEGAMQVADVWLNGVNLGRHDNSGYTWFSFDVSGSKINLIGNNILVVRLDNRFNGTIPPGCAGQSTGLYPDYYLFSGLYRDVWLVCSDNNYIPLYGQRISVSKGPYTTGAAVRIRTTVKNDAAEAKNITLRYFVVDEGKTKEPLLDSATMTVQANASALFDQTMTIVDPILWSPEHPSLYRIFTQVFSHGVMVDDYIDRFGVRWYDWTSENGFSLNGTHTFIKGVCLHQSIGWIENALPASRFFKEIELVKDMGANLIRCSHFPRDPSFYNGCDELGMLSMVEIPSWGAKSTSYPDSFWLRVNNTVAEMIEVGYNHPSIIAWGLFNEPQRDYSGPNQMPLLQATAKTQDSTRMTYAAYNIKNASWILKTDIIGLNYATDLVGSITGTKARTINTEYHEGWLYWCFRGDNNDNETEADGYSQQRWTRWTAIRDYQGTNSLAGGCMWSFNDYWSPFMDHPMGVVDHLRVPKAVFYFFRNQWTGKPSDTPAKGLTPAKVSLSTDLDSLFADGTDVAVLTASVRDASDKCVHTGFNPGSIDVTFNITEELVDHFGPLTINAVAGKCALLIKSKNSTGSVSISASAPNLTGSAPITVRIVPPDTSFLGNPFTRIMGNNPAIRHERISVKRTGRLLCVSFASKDPARYRLTLVNPEGRSIPCKAATIDATAFIDINKLIPGFYFLGIQNKQSKSHEALQKIIITR